MNSPTFNIYIPSYKRAKTACTHKILEYYTYVVRQSELQDYIDAGIDPDHIWAVEDSEINNLVKVVNYIVNIIDCSAVNFTQFALSDFIIHNDKQLFVIGHGFLFQLRLCIDPHPDLRESGKRHLVFFRF